MESDKAELWERIMSTCQQVRADGLFRCTNPEGEAVLILYNMEAEIAISITLDPEREEDLTR